MQINPNKMWNTNYTHTTTIPYYYYTTIAIITAIYYDYYYDYYTSGLPLSTQAALQAS